MRKDALNFGQHFQAHNGMVWQLEQNVRVNTSIPHVKLVGIKDRTIHKIIATSVLFDRNCFAAIEAPEAA